ncbi:MAG: DUF4433 domain-containing protein [Candidatus Accumulibacter sp.]|jgi:hypothetical protein|nr:DUF4433 domain-containing protein [Accumulibacter sp.]
MNLPKIYHITHVNNLAAIANDGFIWCDAKMARRMPTVIGMDRIKRRRLYDLRPFSHPNRCVGDFVPFYFCPRSVMLYTIYRNDHPGLGYRGGQDPIAHIEADLHKVVAWAESGRIPWCFTTSNAGAFSFEDYSDLESLEMIDWEAVGDCNWGRNQKVKYAKQAEFLFGEGFPWHLIERIGVCSQITYDQALRAFPDHGHRPRLEIIPDWYY